ncbi:MAG: hypothetical protein ACLFVY_06825, partial [Phycisphaerae bacterium]
LDPTVDVESLMLPHSVRLASDNTGRAVLLFPDEWNLRYFQDRNPDVTATDLPPRDPEME